MTTIGRIGRGTTGLLTGLAVLLVVAYAGLLAAGLQPVAVYSGSMVPQIAVGSLAIDRPVAASSVKVGDVITFSDPYVRGRLVTHRVIRISRTDHGLAYRTKGDANPARDPWTISLPAQVGRVETSIPWVGYALVFARTREVRTGLILLASVSLLLAVLRRIWRGPEPTTVGIA
jgi:signal peptidase